MANFGQVYIKIYQSQYVGHLHSFIIAPSIEAFFATKDKHAIAIPLTNLLGSINNHKTDDVESHYPDNYPFSLPNPSEATSTIDIDNSTADISTH